MSATRSTITRLPFLLLILLLSLATAGCGGGGGGGTSTAATGGTGAIVAMIAGRVESSSGAPAFSPAPAVAEDPSAASAGAATPGTALDPAAPAAAPSRAAVGNTRVLLYNAAFLVAETRTDGNGYYQFNLSVTLASLLGNELRVVVELVAGSSQISVPVIPVQSRTVFSLIQVNPTGNALVAAKEVVSSEFGPSASIQTIYSQYFASPATTGRGSIRGVVDVDAGQVALQLDGSTVAKTVQATAPYFTTDGTVRPGVYAYTIHNVEPGTHRVKATSGGKIIERAGISVAALVATPGIDLLFNAVSTTHSIEKVSGDGQSGPISTTLPSPLVVLVKENGAPKPAVTVSFGVTAGVAVFDPLVAITDAQGRAQTMVTFGANAGQVSVRASIQDFPGTFTLFTLQPIDTQTQQGFPIPTITGAEASDRKITVQWSESVEPTLAATLGNFRLSVDGGPFAAPPGDSQISYNAALRQTILRVGASLPLPAGATVRLAISNVLDLEGVPTSPATNFNTNLFTVTDNIPPSAAIESAQTGTNTILVQFSEPVTGADQISRYSVARDGGVVFQPLAAPASVQYNPDTAKARLALATVVTLAPNDRVVVKITNVKDLAGNDLGGPNGFLTATVNASTGDTTAPLATIASADDLTQTAVIQYSEPVDATNARAIANYILLSGNIPRQLNTNLATVAYDPATQQATLTFKSGLPLVGGTEIRIQINNMVDLSGNPSDPSPFVTDPLTVVDKRPPSATIQSASDEQIVVLKWSETIAEPIPTSRFEFSEDGASWTPLNSVAATIAWDPAALTVTLRLSGGYILVGGRPLHVRINRIADLAGNTVQPNLTYTIGPRTVTEMVTTAPSATIQSADDSTQRIVLKFNKRMANAGDRSLYAVSKDNGATYRLLGQTPRGAVAYNDGDLTLTITDPDYLFRSGDLIKVMISGLTDLTGRATNPAVNYPVGPFTAADKSLPKATILSANAESQTILVEFDEPVTGLTGANTILLSKNGGAYAFINPFVTYDAATRRATLELYRNADGTDRVPATALFTSEQTVALRFTAVADTATPPNAATTTSPVTSNSVSVALTSSPTASIVQASDGDQRIVVQFNKPINFSTASAASFEASRNGGTTWTRLSVLSTAFYDAASQRVTLVVRDAVNFVSGDAVRVRMDGIVDTTGIPTWPANGYATAAATAIDTTPPTATITSATDGNQRIVLAFNEPIKNGATVTNFSLSRDGGASFFPLTANSAATYVTAAPVYTVTLTVEPALAFRAGQAIVVRMNNITDMNGTPTVPASGYAPAAATAGDTTAPTGQVVIAEDGANRIVVQFSEAVNQTAITTRANWRINADHVADPNNFIALSNSSVTWNATLLQATVVLNDTDPGTGQPLTLRSGKTFYARIAGVADAAGNTATTPGVSPAALELGPVTVADGTKPTASIYANSTNDFTIVVLFSEQVLGADALANFRVSLNNRVTYDTLNGANATLTYDSANRRSTIRLIGGSLTFTAGDQIWVMMSNIRDLAGNFTSPAVNYEIGPSTAVTGSSTRPQAEIWKATDGEQRVHFKFNLAVNGALTKENYRISRNNGATWVALGAADTIANDPDNTYPNDYILTLGTADWFAAGNLLRLELSNITSVSGAFETIPATGYQTAAFAAQDTKGPTATVIAATDGDQKIVLQFNEHVRLATTAENFRISKDGGTTWLILTRSTVNPAGTVFAYNPDNFQLTLTVGDGVAFRSPDAIRFQIQNVTDNATNPNTGTYNPIATTTPYVTTSFAATDTTRPTASLLSSSDAAQTIVIQFSENATTATAGNLNNYLVSKNGGVSYSPLTAGGGSAVAYNSGNFRATLTVGNGIAFAGGDALAVQLSNIVDAYGNATSPATGYLVTGTASDTTRPTMTFASAIDGTQTLTLTWSERVFNAEVLDNYRLVKNDVLQPAFSSATTSLVYSSAQLRSTLTLPAGTFVNSDVLKMRIYNTNGTVADLAGNALVNPNVAPFTYFESAAVTVTDSMPPTATIQSATDGNRRITLLWSEAVTNAGTAANYAVKVEDGTGRDWVTLSTANATVTHSNTTMLTTITLNAGTANFSGGNTVRVRASNVRDNSAAQNKTVPELAYELAPAVATDTTVPSAQVVSATDSDQTIKLLWSEPVAWVAPATGFVPFRARKNGVESSVLSTGDITVTWDANTRIMTFRFNNQPLGFFFVAGDAIALAIDKVRDAAGNENNRAFSAEGTATDTTPPVPTLADATDANVVRITYNEAVDAASAAGAASAINPANYLVSRNGGATYTQLTALSAATYDAVAKRVTITIGDPVTLLQGDSVKVAVKNVADAAGNRIPSFGVITNAFTVQDGVAPSVTSHAATGRGFEIVFSEAMQAGTVTDLSNYIVESPPGSVVSAAVMDESYDPGARTLRVKFTGTAHFTYGSAYRIRIGAVLDTAGNAVGAPSNDLFGTVDSVVSLFAGVPGGAGVADTPRTSVLFNTPGGMAFSPNGNLYLADMNNVRIRYHVAATDSFSTYAPAGLFTTPIAVASHRSVDGDCWIADRDNHAIYQYNGASSATLYSGGEGYVDGDRTIARYRQPSGVARLTVGANALFVADSGNRVIRRVNISTGEVTTFAGQQGVNGTADGVGTAALFHTPYDIAISPDSTTLYVADRGNHRIRKIDIATATVSTLAGSSAGFADGASAAFNTPTGVCADSGGFVYVADSLNHRVRRITPAGVVSTVAGGNAAYADGAGSVARFDSPFRVALSSAGDLYVTEQANHTIRSIKP